MGQRSRMGLLAGAMVLAAGSRGIAEPAPAGNDADRWKERLEQTREKRAAAEEERALRAQIHYESGLEHYREGRLVQAQAEFQKSTDLGHAEAPSYLRRVNAILDVSSDRFANALEDLRKRHGAQLDMQLFEIDKGLEDGDRAVREGRFERAIAVYEKVRDQVRFLPVEVPNREAKLQRVEAALREARVSYEKVRAEDEKRKQEEARRLIQQAEAEQLELARQRIEKMLADAEEAYDNQEYEYAIRLADQVLRDEPSNLDAADLKRRARAANSDRRSKRNRVEQNYAMRQMEHYMEEIQRPIDPDASVVFPDNWLSVRAYREARGQGLVVEETPWKKALRERLSGPAGRPFDYSGTTVELIIAEFEKDMGIQMKLDPKIEDQHKDIQITQFKDELGTIPLDQKLNELTDALGLKWTLKYGGVFISNDEGVRGEMQTRFLDVKDLLVKPLNFSAPSTGFATTSTGGLEGDEEEPEEEGLDLEKIVEIITKHVPEIADAEGEVTAVEETQQIGVKAPVELQAKVTEVLEGLRSQQSLLVDVQARFLRVQNDLADELGITWQGLPGRQVPIAGAPSSGILNEAGKKGDVRFGSGYNSYLGTKFPLGGATRSNNVDNAASFLQFSYINDWQVSMILRAIHTTRKGSIVQAPHLKMFNTQRAYMVVIKEKAYIKDVNAQLGALAGAALDPEIGTIREGTSFEVRPVVSADRKFITLELKPTQAEVIDFRQIDVSSALGEQQGTADPVYIEAPELEIRQIRTTVTVPDNGTILLGGLTAYASVHQYSGLPGISKIPLLNFLFGQDVTVKERNSLMIMIRAMIVDNQEEEERQFGRR